MPTYEYRCSSCKRTFEAVQSFSDAPLKTCEECGGELKRVFHPVGVVLRGSGFYSTDNRSTKSLSPGKSEGTSEGTSKGQSEGKSEKTGKTETPKDTGGSKETSGSSTTS